MAERNNIVEDWLRSLNLAEYTQAFIDNGYDDLEVCKQIGEEDLDAIKVDKQTHRDKLLRAVQVLREEGGTAVYFTLEETDDVDSGTGTSPRTSVTMKGGGGGGGGGGSDTGDKTKTTKLKPAASTDVSHCGGAAASGGVADGGSGSEKLGSSSTTVQDSEALLPELPPATGVVGVGGGVPPASQTLSSNPGSMALTDSSLHLSHGTMAGLEGGDWLSGGARRMDAYDIGQKALFSFTKVHLRNMLNDKLYEDEVYLANPPYTTQEGQICRSSVLALAIKYADQLQTHLPHVLDSLEDLWELAHSAVHYSAVQGSSIPLHPMYGAPHHHYGYGLGQRGLPPPLPSCPPHHLEAGHRHDIFAHQNYVALDGAVQGLRWCEASWRPNIGSSPWSAGCWDRDG
ncbi:uncharacterized protein LOC143283476 [Babylonia areolata]|uniref:uncharacterized protein LOC143283476 n=1 Tax=Babylonia areolata TaxID=304850 RepID=UPI003FD1931D